jgi:hypothetical protein
MTAHAVQMIHGEEFLVIYKKQQYMESYFTNLLLLCGRSFVEGAGV